MVVLKICGLVDTVFTFYNEDSRNNFCAGMIKKFIKKRDRLAKETVFTLIGTDGEEVADTDEVGLLYPGGATLFLAKKKKEESNETKEIPYNGEVYTSSGFQDQPIVRLFSPLQPCGFVRADISDSGEMTHCMNYDAHLIPIQNGKGMEGYDLSYGLDFLEKHVHAYFDEEDSLWVWMKDGQVIRHTLVKKHQSAEGYEKELEQCKQAMEKDRKEHEEKEKGLTEQLEEAKRNEEIYEESLKMVEDEKRKLINAMKTLQEENASLKNQTNV